MNGGDLMKGRIVGGSWGRHFAMFSAVVGILCAAICGFATSASATPVYDNDVTGVGVCIATTTSAYWQVTWTVTNLYPAPEVTTVTHTYSATSPIVSANPIDIPASGSGTFIQDLKSSARNAEIGISSTWTNGPTGPDDGLTALGTCTIIPTGSIVVRKFATGGKPLGGASFTLSGNHITPQSGKTATPSGTVTFSGLTYGNYTVTETAAPAGYLLATPASVVVTLNNELQTVSFTDAAAPGPGGAPQGYDLCGRDGGVFVFPVGLTAGFYGSLPGLHIHVNNIVGMGDTADNRGYFLVGSDGGVFSFGDAPFEGSLPGNNVHVNNIVGIVPTPDDLGYYLVDSGGGVYTFGDAHFVNSLPGLGVHVNDIVGLAVDPTSNGYWLVGSNGSVYAFGSAQYFGGVPGLTTAIAGIESTPDGGGYWIATQSGAVFDFGDAQNQGSLPSTGVAPAHPVVSLVSSPNNVGYWLLGNDGGVFALGGAPFFGSLPQINVSVNNIIGAVPTRPL